MQLNLIILLLCQLLAVSGTVLIVTIGGLVGTELAGDPAFATLPLSILVLGTAIATVLAALLMRRVGRRLGFMLGAGVASSSGFLAAYALYVESFVLFCVSVGLYGANNAFVQQYRFAAAESVGAARASRAISLVLVGAIGGAVCGPLLATEGRDWVESHAYMGSMMGVGVLQGAALLLLAGLREHRAALAVAVGGDERRLGTVIGQPRFVVAALGGVVAYGVMTLVMTATPLSMHLKDGHSLEDTAWVVQSHVLAMYVPSLFSGALIGRFGARPIMMLGVAAFLVMVLAGLQGHAVMHYWWALVMLGLGWNFLFVGGTALLVESYRPAERFKAQAVNEFSVFGTSAAASLLAGTLIHDYGWNTILWSTAPILVAMLGALLWLKARGRLARSTGVSARGEGV